MRSRRKGQRLKPEGSRQQLKQVLEQANCLVWQANVYELSVDSRGWWDPFDEERGTGLYWDIQVVNESASSVPSWLPVAREQGQSIMDAWLRSRDPEDAVVADRTGIDALKTGKSRYSHTFRTHLADGTVRWTFEDVSIKELSAVLDPTQHGSTHGGPSHDGRPLRRWRLIGVVTDVTEKTLAEQRQKALAEQLQQITDRAICLLWQASVDEVYPVPFWTSVFDPDRKTALAWRDMVVINEADVLRWLPIERHGDEQIAYSWVRARLPEDNEACNRRSSAAFRSGADRYSQTFRARVADGSIRWLQEDVRVEALEPSPERCPSGEPLRRWRLTGVVMDVTEQKRSEERQQTLAEELHRSNAALQEFVYVASHDLKEPLRKIQSFGNLLRHKAGPNLTGEALGYLERMVDATGRMQTLIQALLEYSKVTGKSVEKERVDLNAVVVTVLGDLEELIVEQGAVIQVEPLPCIYADAIQMSQLFQNLLANALKFRRPDVALQVRVTATIADDKLCLRFADNGQGFAPEHAERIFQLFERLDGRTGTEGSGIGLSICKKIVERHGGTITATGTPGEGATFIVTLPRRSNERAN